MKDVSDKVIQDISLGGAKYACFDRFLYLKGKNKYRGERQAATKVDLCACAA
jgi:hypothetical protein